jgi:cyclohexanecarboxylate-CoA ligase
VCWQLPNWLEAAAIHLASIRVGAVSTPIVPIYRHREVAFIVRQSRARVLFIPSLFRGFDYPRMMSELRAELPDLQHVISVGASGNDQLAVDGLDVTGDPVPFESSGRSVDDVAVMLYSSGTTGYPKGILHTHRSLGHELRSFVEFLELDSSHVVLMPSPLTHITGLLYGIHLPAVLGSTVVLQDIWKPDEAWRLIAEHSCRLTVGATPFLRGLLDAAADVQDRPTLDYFLCGGADVPADLVRKANSELGCVVTRGYGATELPTATLCNRHDSVDKRSLTDGRPMAGVEVRVVDSSGTQVDVGRKGVLHLRGPEQCLGYLDSDANEESFTADGWWISGDLGFVDRDGYLTITGRVKDLIIRGGENLAAGEIESLVAEHPAVADVAVLGMPDRVLGERVCAFVVLKDGAALSVGELGAFLAGYRLAKQKYPERIEVIDELPRTASGKVQKHILRARIEQLAADQQAKEG